MEHGLIGEVASLRKLFPTVGYYAYDGRKLIEPIRASDYKGLTKPWAYLSVALLAYTLLKRAAPTVEDIVPDLDLKIDAVLFFLAPYAYSLWHVSSEDAESPATYPQS